MSARRVGVDGVLPTVVARYSLPSPEKKSQPKTIGELLGEVHPCRAGAPPRLFMATAGAPPRLRGRKSRSADAKLAGKTGEYARRSPAFGYCCVAKEIEGRSLSAEDSADHPLCVAARNVARRKRLKPPVSRLSVERRRMAEVLRPSRKEEPDHIAKLMPARRVGVDGVLPTVVARYNLPSPEKKPQPKTIGELLGEVHPCRAGAPPRLFMATAGAPPRL
nr:hypothetical protein Iba_chr13dCG6150 [Ipomoea batatas]